MPIPKRANRPGTIKSYESQWFRTAKNKIKRILNCKGDSRVADKYRENPKWKGKKTR